MIAYAPEGSFFAPKVESLPVPMRCEECGWFDVVVPIDSPFPALARCECGAILEEGGTRQGRFPRKREVEAGVAPAGFEDFKPQWLYNLGHEPVYVESRRHYHELLSRRGLHNEWTDAGASKGNWDETGRSMERPSLRRKEPPMNIHEAVARARAIQVREES